MYQELVYYGLSLPYMALLVNHQISLNAFEWRNSICCDYDESWQTASPSS
jgi:hypothetical protein